MRSSPSNTAEIRIDTPISALSPGKKPSPYLTSLEEAGVRTLQDLLWLLPLRALPLPKARPFRDMRVGELFLGRGKIIHCQLKPAFGRRHKGRFLLHDAHLVVREHEGDATATLRFFNLYPNQRKQFEALDDVYFLGTPQEWRAQIQFMNPKLHTADDADWVNGLGEWLIEYPTVNKVPGVFTGKLMSRLPSQTWSEITSPFGTDLLNELSLARAFEILHGRVPAQVVSPEIRKAAEERLAYEEFFVDQLKITTRRRFIKKKVAPVIEFSAETQEAFRRLLPFTLTHDQLQAVEEIVLDMRTGHPMMRMVQGDVGCGKTVVAILAALAVVEQGGQVAFMCPTEALAMQHARTLGEVFGKLPFLKPALLLGSMKKKEKDSTLKALASGDANFVIGTHALFQATTLFHKLEMAIIDEQHKFGVEQRLMLTAKGAGTHCLIMSATPIPRTLSLAQYGDLDFTTIRHMPAGRQAIKTRIVETVNHGKYIEFLRARLAQGERGYFVYPAIDESETMDLQNVKEAFEDTKTIFPGIPVAMLHGKMKAEEKESVVAAFTDGRVRLLLSTTVVEVGINVPDATFMSIHHPERFGLSSLHQLRGRVGRGGKAAFCFLVLDQNLGEGAMERLKVLEETLDGFKIAEADLQNRGEGDLFGVDQSGTIIRRRIADPIKHSHILEKVYRDVRELLRASPEKIDPILLGLARDQKILDTI